eukprot:4707112-Lingulodinium_polyedra.AAC.1
MAGAPHWACGPMPVRVSFLAPARTFVSFEMILPRAMAFLFLAAKTFVLRLRPAVVSRPRSLPALAS